MSVRQKSLTVKSLYLARNLHSRELFGTLEQYVRGKVLDVGGWDFYLTAIRKKLNFNTWTTLEYFETRSLELRDKRVACIVGDGCNMPFQDNHFDTILSIQVLEHVFEPIQMVNEISRALKPNGQGIFLIPQTGTIHGLMYYNFTKFWIKEVMEEAGLDILELKPLGGVWSSMASHLVYFFLQSIRYKGFSSPECKRNAFFYLLYPFMIIFIVINTPICMLLSLGDLTEEPNNHLVVVRKRSGVRNI
jgi:SAM-dependent methyltransferase